MALQPLNHKHIVVTANGLATPLHTAAQIEAWLTELVDKVGMKILFGPHATRCETDGNEGCTGVVCIETSHASVHVWDTGCEPFAKMDLYSCKDFSAETVIEHFQQFGPASIHYMIIDRNGARHSVVRKTVRLRGAKPNHNWYAKASSLHAKLRDFLKSSEKAA